MAKFKGLFAAFSVFILAIGVLGLVSCGDGGSSSPSASEEVAGDSTPPEFAGIVLAYSPYTDQIAMSWANATDDVSESANMKYMVYVGSSADSTDLMQEGNLLDTVQDDGFTATGLTADTTYYCLVVAEDEAGNINSEHTAKAVKTLAENVEVSETFKDTSSMDVEVEQTGDDSFVLTGADAADIEEGDVLTPTVTNEDGSTGYVLKKVVSTEGVGTVTVTTEDASLEEVITSGELVSSASVPDLDDVSGVSVSKEGASEELSALGFSGDVTQRTYKDPGGRFEVFEKYPAPFTSGADGLSSEKASLGMEWTSGNVTLDYGVTQSIGISTASKWEWGSLKYAQLAVAGNVTLDIDATYDFAASGLYTKTGQKLYSTTVYLNYAAGPVPVSQTVTMELLADITIDAKAEIHTTGSYTATKTLGNTFGWSSTRGLYSSDTGTFTQTLTYTVDLEGGLTATLTVYPKITTTFYGSATGALSIKPTLLLEAAVQSYPLDYNALNVELSQFDIDYALTYELYAGLKIFSLTIAEGTFSGTLASGALYSLPEISMNCSATSISTGGTTTCSLSVTDGVNNKVSSSNITWWESSPDISISTSSDKRTATISGVDGGSGKVYVSTYGSGFLGSVGTRYDDSTITVGYADADGDGYTSDVDCNDSSAAYNPSTVWYKDSDADGYSDGTTATQCTQPTGYYLSTSLTSTSGDCNDSSATYNPATVWYKDADGDGYSDGSSATQCTQPSSTYYLATSLTATSGDLDDSDPGTTSLAAGLVAYYAFSGNANDSSGNGNNGTVSGAALTADRSGASNSAYSFDGTNDYISIADSSSLDLATAATFAAWVRPNDITTNRHYEILRKNGTSSGYLFAFQEYGAYLTIGINTDTAQESNTSITASALTNGSWHFVAGTYDGANFKVYVDGALVGTKAQTGSIGGNSSSLYIGSASSGNEFFNGSLDEVRVYNRALNSTEISALYSE